MSKKIVIGLIIFLVIILASGGLIVLNNKNKTKNSETSTNLNKDKYLDFLTEVHQTILNNYWEKLTDEQLGSLWILATEKIIGQSQPEIKNKSKEEVFKVLKTVINTYKDEDTKKQFTTTLADTVLSNLQPLGRSRLYTQKEETALSDTVQNKTGADQYQALGVKKNASSSAISEAYSAEIKKLEPNINSSPEAKEKYQQIQKAYKILSDPISKKNYDLAGVEPTMEYKLLNSNIYYVHLTKFSPNSLEEFNRVMDKVKDKPENLDTLIFDLRDNIGGSIDIMPYFLGPFIGTDQYAYQFLHQSIKDDYKTKTGWLASMVRYKKVVILINENSQSTAELMASVLKKYNVGVLVGVPSKGWGTVEKVFTLNQQVDPKEHNSVFLVHSLTIREDGQAIEGKGVEPKVDIRSQDWQNQLKSYFNNQEIIDAVKDIVNKK